MVHVREGDPPNERVILKREIPLWGLLVTCGSVIASVVGTAFAVGWQVQSLSERVIAVASAQQRTTSQLDALLEKFSAANIKDREHDLKIESLTGRVAALEGLYPRQAAAPAPASK